MKTICAKIKLKPNSLQRLKEWAEELNKRKYEALETLKDEGVYIEAAFIDKTEIGDFLIYFMKVDDLEHANQIAKRSKHAIDAYHKKFKIDCWESKEDLELLIDFDRYSEKFK